MKKLMISMLAMAAMVSCTSEGILDDETTDTGNALVPIKLSAGIIGVETKTIIDGTADVTNVAILQTNILTTNVNSFKWSTATDIINKSATIKVSDMTINLEGNSKLYYPTDPTQSAVIGAFYPGNIATGDITNGVVTFTPSEVASGDKDIMWAGVQTGTKADKDSPLTLSFTHKLSQLQFKFTKDASFSGDLTITKMDIKGTKLPESINLDNGAITYATTSTPITISKTIALDGTENSVTVLVEANAAPTITLDITLSDGTTVEDVDIQNLTTSESTANKVELTFKQQEINAKASIAPWKTGTTGTGDVI